MNNKESVNEFLVSCFYSILDAEERALETISNGKLSLKEIHIIEAVFRARAAGENNFSAIAKLLGVTLGTLTVSFNKLESKGYLIKKRDRDDKRVFYIEPTRLAELINNEHAAFHKKMVEGIVDTLSPEELNNLVTALGQLSGFFGSLK